MTETIVNKYIAYIWKIKLSVYQWHQPATCSIVYRHCI